MVGALARIFDDAGRLFGVTHTLYGGDPRFITAVGLRFEFLTAWFRAVPEDDALAVSLGESVVSADEVVENVSAAPPWDGCIDRSLSWAWELTNQQGYVDGARFEFGRPNEAASVIVELVVVASAIRLFVSREVRTA
jgi:hypothetical protein